jgi:ribose transport system permease protein
MKTALTRFWSNYGMAGVLLLLCLYYSVATLQEQRPHGEAAARSLATTIARTVPGPATILIVAKSTDEDGRFADELERRLKRGGYAVPRKVLGDPRAARVALDELATQGVKLAAIATTPDCASWAVFDGLADKYPALGAVSLRTAASYRWPTFLKPENLLNVANQIVVVAVIAVGMTMVIITGGIDLSVGSLIALSAVVTGVLIRNFAGAQSATPVGMVLCCLAGIGISALLGAFSGLMVTFFKVPPFIATLGVMQVASGLAYIIAKGSSIYEIPDSFVWLGRGVGVLSIPNAVILMVVIFAIAHVLMSRTTLGRYIYAVGGNIEAARLSGVRVGAVLMFVYTVSGAMAGLGGIVTASQLKSASPTYGLMYELYVIAAVVVGGTSLAGGEGRILGTLIGAFIIAVIQNGMNLTGVESYTQKVVLGLVILGAVLLDMMKKRGWRMLIPFLKKTPTAPVAAAAETKSGNIEITKARV